MSDLELRAPGVDGNASPGRISESSGTPPGVILSLRNVERAFGTFMAVNGVSLDIYDGEFFTIVGPSGSGKTTMARMLVGMDKPTAGDICLHGKRINDIAANKRPTCMVFQSLALFPHRSVGQNIEFPLKVRGSPARERKERALQLLDQLRLPRNYYDKTIMQCSGGERQRVALARALAFDPEILFFDEPLSALDYQLRKLLEKELKDIHRQTGKTFIYITHSLEEAMVMSDRIGVMNRGRFIQVGTPREIYGSPRSRFVSQFMGEVNIMKISYDGEAMIDTITGHGYRTPEVDCPSAIGVLVVRPEDVRFVSDDDVVDNRLTGDIVNEYLLGSRVQYQVRVHESQTFLVERLREHALEGERCGRVTIGWNVADSIVFPGSD